LTGTLHRLLQQLDNDPSLLEPNRLRQRLEALDRLDAYLPYPESLPPALHLRAQTIAANLEAVNLALYDSIRHEIQRGTQPEAFLQCIHRQAESEEAAGPANNMGYDYLDELLAGVLQFEEPTTALIQTEPEIVPYQPTPARHIFDLLAAADLTASDVLVDLGSGLGHVPLLASICTPAHSIGIELELAYVDRARQCAHSLNLSRATFLQQDARTADLSFGTVFYLHTPFTGSILRRVLDLLMLEAAKHPIRICTYGPCTSLIADEPWLQSNAPPQTNRIALFLPRD